ncbi:phospholipid-binding lipoprotein MlaA [Actimicrobium sp. GrIS 1.19]|nr:phospholipid-binding lipoprotein MlaA [Actimicrobium sp. GrIS 1.19]
MNLTTFKHAAMLTLVVALSGCATTRSNNPQDPFEGFNRSMFSFNDGLDRVVLKPAATVYKNVLPQFVQTGVGNFFGNLGDVWTAVNNLLQGKLENGMNDVMRVAINTTFGIAGVLDIGSEVGLQKHNEDFGQTLGVWGVKSGPYVVLPLFGPSTLRDTAATPVDFAGDIWGYKKPVNWRNVGTAVRLVDLRASVLDASTLIEDAAIDRYEFIRDAYLQRRQSKINDGDSPASKGKRSSLDDEPLQDAEVTTDKRAVNVEATDAAATPKTGEDARQYVETPAIVSSGITPTRLSVSHD